jgi:hypothetical protein
MNSGFIDGSGFRDGVSKHIASPSRPRMDQRKGTDDKAD